MIDPKILERANSLTNVKFNERQEPLAKNVSSIKRKAQLNGIPYSSAVINQIREICESEVGQRVQIVWESLQRAHETFGSPISENLSTDFKEELGRWINKIEAEISALLTKWLFAFEKKIPFVNIDLKSAKQRATDKVNIEIDLYVDRLTYTSPKQTIRAENIFICHAAEDRSIAEAIKNQLEKVFDNDIKVFVSSIPGIIPPGSDWFDSILKSLNIADAFLIVFTPVSQHRQFVWFEIGFSWFRKINNKCEMYVLFANPIKTNDLPSPLDRLQAIPISSEEDIKAFFEKIIGQFGRGDKNALCYKEILTSIPIYSEDIRDEEEENKNELTWEKPFYWRIDGEKKEGPFCQKCYESDGKPIHLQDYGNDVWHCLNCKNKSYGPSFRPPTRRIAKIDRPFLDF
jgi:ribosomal protein L37AE/L43A